MSAIQKIIFGLLMAAIGVFIAVFLVYPILDRQVSHQAITSSSTAEENPSSAVLDKASEVMQYIDDYFIGEYDETTMADSVSSALVSGTGDRWSYYIPASEMETYQEQSTNSYVGIGITIQQHTDSEVTEVTSVTKKGPAYEAGIMAGDILVSVDGKSVSGLSVNEIKNLVRGEVGSSVCIGVKRGDLALSFPIERQLIQTEVASYSLLDDHVGYITIDNFDENCASHTIACIEQAMQDQADSLIFDVRFNPGGYKSELVQVLDYLLPEGPLFTMRDYAEKESTDYSDARCVDLPIVVLVNEDSYSAAEFFAAALQEYGVAKIVGGQTCGKGYFQYTYYLSDGSAVSLSSGTYYTPQGKSLAGIGVTPDYPVELKDEDYADLYYGLLAAEDDLQLQKALSLVKRPCEK